MTTTGYATADFDLWPTFSKGILFALMFVGGSAGSTSGSVKVIRLLVQGVANFYLLYLAVFVVGSLLISLEGLTKGRRVLGY